MFADTTSKNQSIDAALEGHKVGTDKGGNTVNKDVEGQAMAWLIRVGNDAKVRRTCHGLPTTLFVEDLLSS
ncbi:hypothetical protein HG531_013354 [Fusarium graminearum]|nr:hypothetical protein HG531_013354 [Fusarium graminearum]